MALHVLHVIDGLSRSGAEQSLAAMASHWVRLGVTLDVAYFHDRAGLQDELLESGAQLFCLSLTGGRAGRIRRLRRLVHDRRPELIHTTLWESNVAGRITGLLSRVPVVSSLVNVAYGPEQLAADPTLRPLKVRAAQLIDMATAQWTARFHSISELVATVMGRRLHIPPERIDVIPRGRDPHVLGRRSPERRAQARASLGLRDGGPLVLAAARQEPQKGLDVLLRAVPAVLREFPNARLLVAGRQGKQTPELQAMVHRLGLEDAVRFLGERADVPELLCAADAWVEPSRWEGGPGAMLEAMALEVPIVASDLEVYREAVTNGETAVLVPGDDPVSLGAAIVRTLTDPTEAGARAKRARARFLERFTIENIAQQMLGFYGRALQGHS